MRADTNPRIDQAHFKRTASRTKKVNLGARVFRGGFRF